MGQMGPVGDSLRHQIRRKLRAGRHVRVQAGLQLGRSGGGIEETHQTDRSVAQKVHQVECAPQAANQPVQSVT